MRKRTDLVGQKFGRLTVVADDPYKDDHVICKCSCGTYTSILKYALTKKNGSTKSCGCLRKDIVSEIGKRVIKANSESVVMFNKKYNTNFSIIEHRTASKRNTSGCVGVHFLPSRGKYQASITLHNKKINLGTYTKLEDAIKARQRAEEELFDPLIALKRAEMV